MVIAGTDLQYMHVIGLKGDEPQLQINDAVQYPIDKDAEHVEWSTKRGVLERFLECPTAQKLCICALQLS